MLFIETSEFTNMAERNIAAEVLAGLHEIREHRAGKRTLRTTRVEAKPLPGLTPDMIKRIRAELDVSRAVFAPDLDRTRSATKRFSMRALHTSTLSTAAL